jgi:transcriptional regulator with XRE-family HTH domain
MVKARNNPGERLRSLRLAVGLTLRDVHRESLVLARKLRNSQFIIPASRLHDFETKNKVPGVHKLYTLARIYQCGLNELLRWYGIPRR